MARHADGEPAIGTDGDMDGLAVEWRYDPRPDQYARTNGGQVHSDALSGPITSQNVIVMVVVYRPSPADARSPEAQTIGSGEAMVFTGGVLVRGTWTRADRLFADHPHRRGRQPDPAHAGSHVGGAGPSGHLRNVI